MDRIKLSRLTDRVWLMDDARESTGYIITGDDKALVIDTMIGYQDVMEVVRRVTDLPVMVVNTHGHCDHIFGNIYFDEAYIHPDDLPIAHEHCKFPEFIAECEKQNKKMPPFRSVNGGDVIELGGAALDVIHFPGHTPGGLLLYYREERTLFTGDSINHHLWEQLPESASLTELLENLNGLKDVLAKTDRILHGHATGFDDVSLAGKLKKGVEEILSDKSVSESDKDYNWFGGIGKQHVFDDDGSVICYTLEKLPEDMR